MNKKQCPICKDDWCYAGHECCDACALQAVKQRIKEYLYTCGFDSEQVLIDASGFVFAGNLYNFRRFIIPLSDAEKSALKDMPEIKSGYDFGAFYVLDL